MPHLLAKIRSWFHEVIVESWDSPVNGKIDVSLVDGKYVLNSGPSNYSFGSLHRVFKQVIDDEILKVIEYSPVLLLGLGAGSVMNILHRHWDYEVPITGVESDPTVIEAGKKYFGLGKDPLLEIVNMDAMEYVDQCENVFGLIIVDLYVGKDVPETFEQESFLRKLSGLVARPGMLMFNKIVHDEKTRSQASRVREHIERYFDETRIRRIKEKWENHIIIGENVKHDRTGDDRDQ